MKHTFILSLIFAAGLASAADTTVTLSGVHNCCKSCTNGITKAATSVKDVTVTAEGGTVKVTAKSKASAKKAVEAINAAGYFGTSDAEASTTTSATKPAKKLTEATVSGAHLCCGKCVKAMTDAVKSVAGVTETNIVSKESTFTVKGDFTESDLLTAMNKAGFTGEVK
ncbi:MAG: cation transporter [Prosthecobacter sp.]